MNLLGNIGTTELVVIFLLALIVLGPEKLPELARKVGTLVRDLRRVYANLSKDLGPELSALPSALQEMRDTADALKSLPTEAIRTLSQAASTEPAASSGLPSKSAPPAVSAPGVDSAPSPSTAGGSNQLKQPGTTEVPAPQGPAETRAPEEVDLPRD